MKNKFIKLHILFFVLLAPILMATQCEDDFDNSGFETTYFVQNDSGVTLFMLRENNILEEIINSSTLNVGSELNSETVSISPSESFQFSNIKLYVLEDGNYNLVYEQSPINDNLWVLSEPSVNRFEYKLTITPNLLN